MGEKHVILGVGNKQGIGCDTPQRPQRRGPDHVSFFYPDDVRAHLFGGVEQSAVYAGLISLHAQFPKDAINHRDRRKTTLCPTGGGMRQSRYRNIKILQRPNPPHALGIRVQISNK